MPRQFTAKSKDSGKTKKDQWMSYVNEPLDKFRERIKKEGEDLNNFEITNSDISIDDEGFMIIGQVMDLMSKLGQHVTDTKRLVEVHDAVENLKKEAEAAAKKKEDEEKKAAAKDAGVADTGGS